MWRCGSLLLLSSLLFLRRCTSYMQIIDTQQARAVERERISWFDTGFSGLKERSGICASGGLRKVNNAKASAAAVALLCSRTISLLAVLSARLCLGQLALDCPVHTAASKSCSNASLAQNVTTPQNHQTDLASSPSSFPLAFSSPVDFLHPTTPKTKCH